jgi:hypothetical protein
MQHLLQFGETPKSVALNRTHMQCSRVISYADQMTRRSDEIGSVTLGRANVLSSYTVAAAGELLLSFTVTLVGSAETPPAHRHGTTARFRILKTRS